LYGYARLHTSQSHDSLQIIIIIIIIITYDYNSQCKAERSVLQGYISFHWAPFHLLAYICYVNILLRNTSVTDRSTRSSPGTCRVPTARALNCACHPDSNSIIRIPIRTKTETKEHNVVLSVCFTLQFSYDFPLFL
jgi:hypothetical protein